MWWSIALFSAIWLPLTVVALMALLFYREDQIEAFRRPVVAEYKAAQQDQPKLFEIVD